MDARETALKNETEEFLKAKSVKPCRCDKVLHSSIYLDGKAAAAVCTPEGMEDNFRIEEDGCICWKRRTKEPVSAMVMEVKACFAPRHTMVPSVSYDGNPWGKDHEYKGYEKDGIPYTFSWHRTAVQGASTS